LEDIRQYRRGQNHKLWPGRLLNRQWGSLLFPQEQDHRQKEAVRQAGSLPFQQGQDHMR
jgi:hypothetical protein